MKTLMGIHCLLRTETMIFSFFLLSAVFLQPLIKNGYWAQYNRFFGTPKHLASEFRKSDDALFVKYIVKKGTEKVRGERIFIGAADSKIILLEKDGFHELNKNKYSIRELIPEHTGMSFQFEQLSFMNISIDSLNTLVQDAAIKYIDIQMNNHVLVHYNNQQEVSTKVKIKYPEHLWFENVKEFTFRDTFISYVNPKIKTLQNQMHILKKEDQNLLNAYQSNQLELANLKTKYAQNTGKSRYL